MFNFFDKQKRDKFKEFEEMFPSDKKMVNFSKATWLTSRGNFKGERNELDSAITDFQEALLISPNHSPALLGLCVAHQAKGMLDEALSDINKMPEKTSNSIDNRFQINFHKGLIYLQKNDAINAKKYLQDSLAYADSELKQVRKNIRNGIIPPGSTTETEDTIAKIKYTLQEIKNSS